MTTFYWWYLCKRSISLLTVFLLNVGSRAASKIKWFDWTTASCSISSIFSNGTAVQHHWWRRWTRVWGPTEEKNQSTARNKRGFFLFKQTKKAAACIYVSLHWDRVLSKSYAPGQSTSSVRWAIMWLSQTNQTSGVQYRFMIRAVDKLWFTFNLCPQRVTSRLLQGTPGFFHKCLSITRECHIDIYPALCQ